MNQQVELNDVLTLIVETANAARVAFADAAMLAANMDLRSSQAKERGDKAMQSLKGLTAFMHAQPTTGG